VAPSGMPMLLAGLAGLLLAGLSFVVAGIEKSPWPAFFGAAVVVTSVLVLSGLFTVGPGEAQVLQLFGDYRGSVRKPGLGWANPFMSKKRISLRVRNFESSRLKVNDQEGSPIEIAAVVVWRVVDSAEAVFEVDNYEDFVRVQSEAALRNLATQHPYDNNDGPGMSLRGHTAEVAEQLKIEVQARLSKAGVEVLEARFSHLAYAAEIAAAMLRRQQAGAVIAARSKIVEGAVSMVEMAIQMLESKNVVQLDPERKAAMVSNLLVVLCGEAEVHPVVNTGTLHTG
jgi:regulator of protease activity HflC (stomatin/prohibitin superfamily)